MTTALISPSSRPKNPAYDEAWRRLALRRVAQGRAIGEPCCRCGKPIDYTLKGNTRMGPTADHLHPLAQGGRVIVPLDQLGVAHNRCNSRHGQTLSRARTAAKTQPATRTAFSGAAGRPRVPSPRISPPELGSAGIRPERPEWWPEVPWLADLAELPPDASWPRRISPPHPDAVGTYGQEAEQLAEVDLGMGGRLRWWLRVALRMQLQHDADGQLLIREVDESTSRRCGKSVRLRVAALHRLRHADRFGEEQLVVHTGKDLPVCKEIIRKAWPTATRWGWKIRQTNGQEEIESTEGHRWMVRGRGSVYGYDTTLGMVDEAWGVEPGVVDDGLEPSLLERLQAQLMLTSTAHRRATTLMRRRLTDVDSDPATLVLLWGAHPGDPIDSPEVWRWASAHWSPAREAWMARKWAKALAGEVDPEDEDDDPVEAFRAQLLNVWPERVVAGQLLVDELAWARLRSVELVTWHAAAVEAAFGSHPVVALAGRTADGRVLVSVRGATSGADAAAQVASAGVSAPVVGKSLLRDPAPWIGLSPQPRGETAAAAVDAFRKLLLDDALRHDGGTILTEQATSIEVTRSTAGVRIVAGARVDAVKAAAWAAVTARVFEPWFAF